MLKKLIKKVARPRILRFAVVGLSGVPVNLGMLWLFSDMMGWSLWLASPLAIEISIIWNFFLNDTWTFSDRKADASVGFMMRLYRYNGVSFVGLGIQFAAALAVNEMVMRYLGLAEPGNWKYPAQMVGIGTAMGWNFLSNFYFTWAQKKPEAPATEDAAPKPVGEATQS